MRTFGEALRVARSERDARQTGDTIRGLREEAGLAQNELARRVGFNKSMMSRIESGERRASDNTLHAIVDALCSSHSEMDALLSRARRR